ncbi:hypothetical protein LT493_21445 [Streptomyces tricolor]|nr:hypothetical protein [Streptomyces tricolor]
MTEDTEVPGPAEAAEVFRPRPKRLLPLRPAPAARPRRRATRRVSAPASAPASAEAAETVVPAAAGEPEQAVVPEAGAVVVGEEAAPRRVRRRATRSVSRRPPRPPRPPPLRSVVTAEASGRRRRPQAPAAEAPAAR